jgi:hypothetical protein
VLHPSTDPAQLDFFSSIHRDRIYKTSRAHRQVQTGQPRAVSGSGTRTHKFIHNCC